MVPGDQRPAYEHGSQARQILNDAEDDLRDWRPEVDPYSTPESGSPTSSYKGKNPVIGEEGEHRNGGGSVAQHEHVMTGAVSPGSGCRASGGTEDDMVHAL